MKAFKRDDKAYLEDQPKLDALIKQLVQDAGDSVFSDFECWKPTEDCIEPIECMSRDGFIAANDNCGGYEATNFTTVGHLVGAGSRFASKAANTQINKQYEYGLKCALEAFKENHAAEIKGIPEDKLNYHGLYELGKGKLAEKLSEYEDENTTSENDSIMLQVRVLYCGVDKDGVHTAYVSACVNWEGPYHRSSGAFYRGVGHKYTTEDFKETQVTFKTLAEAKKKISAALKQVTSKVF